MATGQLSLTRRALLAACAAPVLVPANALCQRALVADTEVELLALDERSLEYFGDLAGMQLLKADARRLS